MTRRFICWRAVLSPILGDTARSEPKVIQVLKAGAMRLAATCGFAACLAACHAEPVSAEWSNFHGDAHNGAAIIANAGCGSCHVIPEISGADGAVGPPLDHFGRHTTVAGLLPNTPAGLSFWIQHPQKVVPGNAMPDMGLTKAQANDVAAYLHSLR
jgi:cytochrome c2